MAQILLHGTLHATIFEAESLSNPHRASGSAPKFIRKVSTSLFLSLSLFTSHTISMMQLHLYTRTSFTVDHFSVS
jgi:hypothetical protein